MDERNIYQELWDLDLRHHGLSVTSRLPDGAWADPEADIKLDEQRELDASGGDTAPNPLFAEIREGALDGPTFEPLKSLMNNYLFNARLTEDHLGENEVEDRERSEFLDAVFATEVLKATRDYVNGDLGFDFSEVDFRAEAERLWFEIYTNHHNGNPVPFCSGFEHVMVGESKSSPGSRGIGGYHSWTKFFWDENSSRVDFKGFNYDNDFGRISLAGAAVPHVATISFTWRPLDLDGAPMQTKRKDLGGFFVGPSPELQMAMPVAAYFESEKGLFFIDGGNTSRERNRKKVVINGAVYYLVLYRETTEDGGNGTRLRSFYPEFRGPETPGDGDGTLDVVGEIAITRALPNPVNPEEGREWVEIENRGESIVDLAGWRLQDRNARDQVLDGQIEPGKTRRIMITREDPDGMQLRNAGGIIRVLKPDGGIESEVHYPQAPEDRIVFFGAS